MTINIIALDGVAGAGKTTIAKKLSKKLSTRVLFSGQLYRAVAYEVIVQKIAPTNMKKIINSVRFFQNLN